METDEIGDYQVVWARVGSWPWWPGIVSPKRRRVGKNLLLEVKFFGVDNRGINTYSHLVSEDKLVLPFSFRSDL